MSHKLTINDWAALPPADATNYEDECRAAAKSGRAFRDPLVGPHMQTVVENSAPQQIEEILWPVRQMCPWMLEGRWAEVLQENDSFGNPVTTKVAGSDMRLSPTTARYARHISQLIWLFGPMRGWHIAEIGGGYGGLCRLLMSMCQPASYTLYDIEGGLQLQQRYLEQLGANEAVAYVSRVEPARYDLIISIAALCELQRPVIDMFGETIISRSDRGYLVWSRPADGLACTKQVKGWLGSHGANAKFGFDEFVFRTVCTVPMSGASVYYWREA